MTAATAGPVGARGGSRTRKLLPGSLSTFLAATIAGVLTVILALFSFGVAAQLRGSLFDARRDAVLTDASLRFARAQETFSQSTATTPDQVQEVAQQVLNQTLESATGAGAIEAMLLRSPESSNTVRINEFMRPEMAPIITDTLRDSLVPGSGSWQSVAYPSGTGEQPGILVGALVDLPQVGRYQMFLLYSLASEQATVHTVLSVLMWGAVPVLLLMAGLTFYLVYRMLRPVREAAKAAGRLAEGDLDVRVREAGRDEMALLGRSFNEMASSLSKQINDYDELSKLQQSFVSDVSHELRTPLTTIRMAEEMIYQEREELSPAGRRSSELLHSEAERFEEMLADLLEISRYDAQGAKFEGEPTDLYLLTQRVIAANQGLADRLGVEVRLAPSPGHCSVPIDGKRIERVVRNLLVNAYEHAEGKPVDVRVVAGETAVALRVRDHGVGMSAETANRVFDRFYRADPARARTTGGTGLGLAIAKEDVALHKGALTARGELGEGSSFVMTLPRDAQSAVTEFPLAAWGEDE